MKRREVLLVLLPVLLLAMAMVSARATTVVVPDDYATVQQAVDAASAGDTVYVRIGTYYEHVTIGKQLTLEGEDRDATIIDGGGSGNVVYVSVDYVTIDGLTVANGGNGIDLIANYTIDHFTIRNSVITGNSGSAINAPHSNASSYHTIEDCVFSYNVWCLYGQQFGYSVIQNCEFFGNGTVMAVGWGSYTTICDNSFHDNTGGCIHIDSGTYNTIERNEMYDNGGGLSTGFVANNNIFRNNIIRNNGSGVNMGGPSVHSNRMYHNDLINNGTQGYDGEGDNYWDNGYPSGGNYWSDYSGVDEYSGPGQNVPGADGIGDTPYVFGSAHDQYPLMSSPNQGMIVCDPDPEYLTATDPVKTIDVDYLGGSNGLMYGYSLVFTWDGAIASTAPVKVTEGTLLSDEGTTFFYPRTTGTNEITVDCALLGDEPGAAGPGTMFSIELTGLAVGTSDVDITIDRIRDKDNNALTDFYVDDGLLIVDVEDPVVTDVLITNDTLGHTNDYIKDTDQATITANVSDDDPAFVLANIVADLTGLGGGGAVNPDTYLGGVATWTLASVTCLPSNGTVTVTVTATDGIGNTVSGSDTITSDNIAPLVVEDFDAAPGHEECALTWTNGYDLYFDGVIVKREAIGGEYPQYPWFVPNWPNVDTAYPTDHGDGTTVYGAGSGTSHTDGIVARNIYYYQAFCYDIARNYGPADPGARDLATNYWLGDVADGWGGWGYDGNVDDDDILKLSGCYGIVDPVGVGDPNGDAECDVGPTVHPDWHRLGLPLPDDKVEFEDLMVFAMNYGVVAPRVVPFLPEEYDASPLAVTLGAADGSDVSVALRLEGNVSEIKGVSAAVSYDPSELVFVSARLTDDMLSPIGDVFFWFGEEEGRVLIDVAVLGTGVTVGGSGDLAILTFRSLTGEYELDVESARLRDVENLDLDARLGGYASDGDLPTVFRLVQNAPNPFNPKTALAYHVPRESEVTIRVYDVAGRSVRTLLDGMVEPGRHVAVWDGTSDDGESVGSGIYFCTMEAPDFRDSRKMTLLK